MNKKNISLQLLALGLIVFTSNSLFLKGNFQESFDIELVEKEKNNNIELDNKYHNLLSEAEKYQEELLRIAEEERIQEERRKEESRIQAEKEKKIEEEKRKSLSNSRGDMSNLKTKQVTCYITYYTNANTKLQGGQLDKRGKRLTSHGENLVACPADIPYGSYLALEGMGTYKVVDTGGAIVWLNKEKTKMKVDVFIPNVTVDWIYKNTNNKTVKGWIYYK